MLKIQNLTSFINSVANSDIDKIKLNKKNTQILINKAKNKNIKQTNVYLSSKYKNKKVNINQVTPLLEKKEIKTESKEENKTKCGSMYSTIVSPMVGTFYKSPAPNEPPFIEIGEKVNAKQPVCIVEAMKLMNEIESEVQGEVVEILVKDGDIVDCGQSLIKIKIN